LKLQKQAEKEEETKKRKADAESRKLAIAEARKIKAANSSINSLCNKTIASTSALVKQLKLHLKHPKARVRSKSCVCFYRL
jgi:hypothetical protein